jgi:hypothetical protein
VGRERRGRADPARARLVHESRVRVRLGQREALLGAVGRWPAPDPLRRPRHGALGCVERVFSGSAAARSRSRCRCGG